MNKLNSILMSDASTLLLKDLKQSLSYLGPFAVPCE